MDRRSAFDVATRALGLWQVLYALDDFGSFANATLKLYEPFHEAPAALLNLAIVHLLPGLFLLFSASTLVNLVYGEPRVDENDRENGAGESKTSV